MAEVRIIGGQWKRSKLPVADNKPGLRPTPDRVRETLFNWLGQDLTGWRVLDAFAGSGALGFEAGSRGAAEVRMLERDGQLADSLRRSKVKLKAEALQIECTNAMTWMQRCEPARFELVLLDPPFDADLFDAALAAAARIIVPDGLIYLEADRVITPPEGFEARRSAKAGTVHYGLFARLG